MTKRWLVDVLIAGTAVTGVLTAASVASHPNAFLLMLALIQLSTAVFLTVVVRPMVRGQRGGNPLLVHGSMVVLFASSAAAFWIEYLTLGSRAGALSAAITWSLAFLIYGLDLALARPKVVQA